MSGNLPRIRCQSHGFSDAAQTRTRTPSSATLGLAMSLRPRTSGDPYLS